MASPSFADEGFAVLPGLLHASEHADARRAVAEALAAPRAPGCERPHNTLIPLRWNDLIVDVVLGRPSRVEAIADACGARDLRWISGYVSIKPAGSPALGWHQDWWCWDHAVSYRREASQVALLCYLTPTDERAGALRLVPRSHHGSPPGPT